MCKCLLALALSSVCMWLCALAQTWSQGELEKVIHKTDNQRKEYIEAFKNLTAVETKTTELFDEKGKVKKARKVVADFLVYQSPLDKNVVNEYRITREIDGKIVRNQEEQAVKFFEKLAKAKTLEQEFKRLREENLKHTLHYYRWGLTLSPLPVLNEERKNKYEFEITGRENINGRATIVLSYKAKELIQSKSRGFLSSFKNPKIRTRGRAWVYSKDLT